MTVKESELRANLLSTNPLEVVENTVKLCNEFLIEYNRFDEAEDLLFTAIGLQSSVSGFVVELTLGELYLKMNEESRAERFLNYAIHSSNDEIKVKASELLSKLKQS